jgi:hypothetical protein
MVAKKAEKFAEKRIYLHLLKFKPKKTQKPPEMRIYLPRKYWNTKFNKGSIPALRV